MDWAITEKNYSQRKACALVGIDRKSFRYASKRPDDETLRKRLRELASERRRFGYRRLGLLLDREGRHVNHKKLYRLYKEEKLTVRRRGGRKRALGTRRPMMVPDRPNRRWSLDFWPTRSPVADGSAFWPWLMTSRGSVLASWSIRRSPVFVLPANSTASPPIEAIPA